MGVVLGLAVAGLFLYWQLVIAEGTYFGQHIVTFLYDLTAARYDSIKQFDRDLEAIFVGRPIAEALGSDSDPLVLDIATGTGRVPLALVRQPSFEGSIVGLDASWKMLEVARSHLEDAGRVVQLICRDTSYLPFLDNCFTMVTCFEMLEFTPSPQRQLQQAFRVLKPDGFLVTTRRRGIDARLMPGKTHSERLFGALLSRIGFVDVRIEAWQMDYDLAWARKPADVSMIPLVHQFTLICDSCAHELHITSPTHVECASCGKYVIIKHGIIDYRTMRQG